MPGQAFPSDFYKCKKSWCRMADVCRGKVNPLRTCRTCDFGDMQDDGEWYCGKKKINLTTQQQWSACDSYKLGWEIEDAGVDQEKPDFKFGENK